jgi:hypothetical protein
MMLPLLVQQQKQGKVLPIKLHTGPIENNFPSPMFCSISFSSPIHAAKGSKPCAHSFFNAYAAKMMAHRSASPAVEVKPSIVKCASLVADLCCRRPSFEHKNFLPPICSSVA